MLFTALILSSLFGCNNAIADSFDVGKTYSHVEISNRVDATVRAYKNKVEIDMHRGWCGEKKCLVGRADGGQIDFSYDSYSMFPSTKLSTEVDEDIKISAEFCDSLGNCSDGRITSDWKNIEIGLNGGKKTLYVDYFIVAPMKSKDFAVDIDYTVSTREVENEAR